VLKTRLQVETTTKATVFAATFAALRGAARAPGGVAGLYRGFSLYTFGGLPSQGAYFFGYAAAKDALHAANLRHGSNGAGALPEACVHLAAGLAADVVAAPLWTPTDVIMQRLQIQGPGVVRYRGAAHAARHIWRHEGVRGLFRGLGASIITFGPASAIWWALYEGCSASLTAWARPPPPPPAAGAAAAAAAAPGAGAGTGQDATSVRHDQRTTGAAMLMDSAYTVPGVSAPAGMTTTVAPGAAVKTAVEVAPGGGGGRSLRTASPAPAAGTPVSVTVSAPGCSSRPVAGALTGAPAAA